MLKQLSYQTLFVNSVPQLENPVPASNFTLQILLQSAFNPAIRSAINDNPGLVWVLNLSSGSSKC